MLHEIIFFLTFTADTFRINLHLKEDRTFLIPILFLKFSYGDMSVTKKFEISMITLKP